MEPEYPDIPLPGAALKGGLVAAAGVPPRWNDSWIRHIPFIGKFILSGINAGRYGTTLEQNADFIASDLSSAQSEWVGQAVGVIDGSK
jgi:hypothetical protein